MEAVDLTNKKFGHLTVLKRMPNDRHGNNIWLCRCDCGVEKSIQGSHLRHGTSSCGCKRYENKIKHGKTHTKTYKIWKHIKARCYNVNNPAYPDYGGRGISMCKEWREDFNNFFRDMGECPEGMSIDRINNAGNYEPGNCRWATAFEQGNNKRNNRILNIFGEQITMAQAARKYNICEETLRNRIDHYGFDPERAVSQPVRGKAI